MRTFILLVYSTFLIEEAMFTLSLFNGTLTQRIGEGGGGSVCDGRQCCVDTVSTPKKAQGSRDIGHVLFLSLLESSTLQTNSFKECSEVMLFLVHRQYLVHSGIPVVEGMVEQVANPGCLLYRLLFVVEGL